MTGREERTAPDDLIESAADLVRACGKHQGAVVFMLLLALSVQREERPSVGRYREEAASVHLIRRDRRGGRRQRFAPYRQRYWASQQCAASRVVLVVRADEAQHATQSRSPTSLQPPAPSRAARHVGPEPIWKKRPELRRESHARIRSRIMIVTRPAIRASLPSRAAGRIRCRTYKVTRPDRGGAASARACLSSTIA